MPFDIFFLPEANANCEENTRTESNVNTRLVLILRVTHSGYINEFCYSILLFSPSVKRGFIMYKHVVSINDRWRVKV